jgi:hypothetical protein
LDRTTLPSSLQSLSAGSVALLCDWDIFGTMVGDWGNILF